MAFNGSGAFARLYNWVSDRNAAIKIRADRMDAEMDGFATGLSNCVTRDGQSTITSDIPFNNKKITGLGDAAAAGDAMSRQASDARYTPRVLTKSANYTLLAADIGSLIVGTGTWTLTLLPAATAANGFSFRIRNNGTGLVTIDPNGAETIDGAATLVIKPNQEVLVISDGSAWSASTRYLARELANDAVTGAAVTAIVLDLKGCARAKINLDVIVNTAVADFGVYWEGSLDGGATWINTAGAYYYHHFVTNGVGTILAAGTFTSGIMNGSLIDTGTGFTWGKHVLEFTNGTGVMYPRMQSTTSLYNGADYQTTVGISQRQGVGVFTHLRFISNVASGIGIGSVLAAEGY